MDKKICRKCNREKSLDCFGTDKRGLGGVRGSCKDCERPMRKKYRAENRDALAAKKRESYQLNINAERERRRRFYMANSARLLRIARDWKEKNQHIVKAQDAVMIAVRRGDMRRASELNCASCGDRADDYHHHSYRKIDRLNVTPLCKSCHGMVHSGAICLIGK